VRGQAQDVVPHGMRDLLDTLLNAFDLGEHFGLIDVALPRRDADQHHVGASEDLFQELGGLDVRVLLRRPRIRVGIELQGSDPRQQKGRDAQDCEQYPDTAGDDPFGKGAKEASGEGHCRPDWSLVRGLCSERYTK
jgi:hypothetical protein